MMLCCTCKMQAPPSLRPWNCLTPLVHTLAPVLIGLIPLLVPLLCWVDEFRYLEVSVTRDLSAFCDKNVLLLISLLWERCASWFTLPLNLLGRINFLKMINLSQFTYVFGNYPIWIPNSGFWENDRYITLFIWYGSLPRLANSTLQLPSCCGGLALPNFQVYYRIGRPFYLLPTGGFLDPSPVR